MLHVPVALITEKLRGQTLEDDHIKVPREGGLQIEGKNVWLSCDGEIRDQEGNTTARDKPAATSSAHGPSLSFLPPLNDNDRLGLGGGGGSRRGSPPGTVPHRFPHPTKPAARTRSNLNEHVVPRYAAFDVPPKKKHCRSLSVPADAPLQGYASTSPLVEGAKVWRPIPIAALTTPTPTTTNTTALLHLADRTPSTSFTSPPYDMGRTLSGFTAIGGRTAARFHRNFNVVGGGGCGGAGGGGGGMTKLPMAPSPLSVDSGRDTTSDLHTPPQSPVPRPASAASLQCHHHHHPHHHHHHHNTAFHSTAWWTHPSGGLRGDVLQSRSLSYEEPMSGGLQAASGSTPCVLGSTTSLPLSPCRSKIPRCHSQPCVLHHRRCGKKRRRDDRPGLDFTKMTETAYTGKTLSTPAQDIHKGRWRSGEDYMCVGGLMPIASSPRDTDLPATPRAFDHTAFTAVTDLEMAATTDLPSTPPSDISSGIDIREPVKLIGEEEEEEEEEELEDQERPGSNCGCHRNDGREDSAGLFPLTDLDLEQIENH